MVSGQFKHRGQWQKGLTLVEVMVVVVIIGLLSGLVGVRVFSYLEKAKISTTKTQIYNLSQALDNFRLDNGFYPTTDQGLDALVRQPTFGRRVPKSYPEGGYLKQNSVPMDPFKQSFRYLSPGTHNASSFDLWSVGKDGEDGTDDDISNWEGEADSEF